MSSTVASEGSSTRTAPQGIDPESYEKDPGRFLRQRRGRYGERLVMAVLVGAAGLSVLITVINL